MWLQRDFVLREKEEKSEGGLQHSPLAPPQAVETARYRRTEKRREASETREPDEHTGGQRATQTGRNKKKEPARNKSNYKPTRVWQMCACLACSSVSGDSALLRCCSPASHPPVRSPLFAYPLLAGSGGVHTRSPSRRASNVWRARGRRNRVECVAEWRGEQRSPRGSTTRSEAGEEKERKKEGRASHCEGCGGGKGKKTTEGSHTPQWTRRTARSYPLTFSFHTRTHAHRDRDAHDLTS